MARTVALALVLAAAAGGADARKHLGRIAPDDAAHAGSLVKPLKFNQQLLICNAYPAKSSVTISKNSQPILAGQGALGFQQCKYAPASVLTKDKLDFTLADTGVEGTFEVGDLPQTDSVLLLVLQKRDAKSSLMAFQSFAFPQNAAGRADAHVAVIDATSDNTKARLQIADRPVQPGAASSTEELSFNRIYALSQGKYDVSVLATEKGEKQQDVELVGGKDYVLLRTDGKTFGMPNLVAYPHDEIRSGAVRQNVFAVLLAALSASLFFA